MSHAMGALVATAIEGSLKGGTTEGTAAANETETETEIAHTTVASIIVMTETGKVTGRGWTGNSTGIA